MLQPSQLAKKTYNNAGISSFFVVESDLVRVFTNYLDKQDSILFLFSILFERESPCNDKK